MVVVLLFVFGFVLVGFVLVVLGVGVVVWLVAIISCWFFCYYRLLLDWCFIGFYVLCCFGCLVLGCFGCLVWVVLVAWFELFCCLIMLLFCGGWVGFVCLVGLGCLCCFVY